MISKIVIFFCSLLFSVIFVQMVCFLYIYNTCDDTSRLKTVDAILVFKGGQYRLAEGFRLVQRGIAKNLIISPADKVELEEYNEYYTAPALINFIIENQATNTFENALYCSRIILSANFQSAILVTSTYHLPRSYFLLNFVLLGTGVEIIPTGTPQSFSSKPVKVKIKLLVREMLKFWGSLYQYAYYKVS